MDCHEANKQIDLRLQASYEGEPQPGRDWSALDLHLADCTACMTEWEERAGVRDLLADVRTDKPTEKETDAMWATIQTNLYAPTPITNDGSPRANILRFARFTAAGVGIAACLAIALLIGQQRGRKTHATFTEIASSLLPGPTVLARDGEYGLQMQRDAGYALSGADALSSGSSLSYSEQTPPQNMVGSVPASRLDLGNPGTTYAQVQSIWGNVSSPDAAGLGRETATPPMRLVPSIDGSFQARADDAGDESGRHDLLFGMVNVGGAFQPAVGDSNADEGAKQTPKPQPRLKLIRTGELSIEVASYESAIEQVKRTVERIGGFLADAATRETTGGALEGQLVIRVSPQRFDALFTAIKAVGRVISEDAKTADVTAEYVDLDARIHSLQITEDRLQELVKSKSIIDKVSALLEVEKEMTRVRAQIEQLQGKQRVMADRVAMSTITVLLREPPRSIPKASFWLEVPVLDDAVNQLAQTLDALGGIMESGKISATDTGSLKAEHSIKVPVSHFAELVTAIESVGRVKDRIIHDWEFDQTTPAWAKTVRCAVFVHIMERSWQLPSGQMRLEVEDLNATLDSLNDALQRVEGAVERSATTRDADGSSTANLTVQSPAGRFPDLVAAMTSLGRVTGKSVSGEAGRIVGGAARAPCSLKLTLVEPNRQVPTGAITLEVSSFKTAQETLADLIDGDTVRVLNSSSTQRTDGTWTGAYGLAVKVGAMERTIGQLEALGSVISRQITGLGIANPAQFNPEATGGIALTLGEKPTITPGATQAGGTIRNQLREGIAGLYESIGLIAYGLMVMAPWLVITLLVGWIVARRWRPKARS